jgi:t-SNARE complex subunit (syntaxin)
MEIKIFIIENFEIISRYLFNISLKSVAQVHQLFIDMAMLVQQQGEMIDDIELNINTAA